jgi:hypothetical protein
LLPLKYITAGFAKCFQTSRDINAVAKNIVAINDDVTDVDADPEDDLLFLGNSHIASDHAALNVYRATYRIDHARKLHQHPVAGGFDNAAMVFRNT